MGKQLLPCEAPHTPLPSAESALDKDSYQLKSKLWRPLCLKGAFYVSLAADQREQSVGAFCCGFFGFLGMLLFLFQWMECWGMGIFSFLGINKEKARSCSAASEEAPLITGSN